MRLALPVPDDGRIVFRGVYDGGSSRITAAIDTPRGSVWLPFFGTGDVLTVKVYERSPAP